MNERLKALADAGVSIWLDDLSRERITSGNLADLVSNYCVTGVTTNPTIFAAALSQGHMYDEQVKELAARDADLHDAIKVLTTDDVRNACDIMADTYRQPTASTAASPSRSIQIWRTRPKPPQPRPRIFGRSSTGPTC